MRILKEIESLWTLFTAPVVWALHFVICYASVAVNCAKTAGPDYDRLRVILAGATAMALLAIVLSAWLAWRQWGFGTDSPPHDAPTTGDRRLFQGFATLLLSGLSFLAVIFTAMPLIYIDGCFP
ncbi:hypothetical protein [Pararhizobium sp.]|uniref:hypothetical protein n=1 Tax=Pararhizobium sp. TaxID=1977563 RepID=UPI00271717E5|nr:hypothetical protein [Pararhizobium sp.]MDO9418503.1 hypothetical protein [Pararhizobium sp.]